jgi:hypothetical protein
MSVAPGRGRTSGPSVIQQVRAAASLLSFTNVLAVSLFSLVPHTNVGYPATALAVVGILFTAARARSIFTSTATRHRNPAPPPALATTWIDHPAAGDLRRRVLWRHPAAREPAQHDRPTAGQ